MIERRLDDDIAIARLGHCGARLGQHPIGKIAAGRQGFAPRRIARRPRFVGLGLRYRPGFDHCGKHQPAALAGILQVPARCQPRRRLHQPGEHRRFTQRQLFGFGIEIDARSGADAIGAIAEIDARQVARQDLVLAQPRLQPQRDDDFLQLALDAAVGRQKTRLGKLLRQRRTALGNAAGLDITGQRPGNAAWIDADMIVEAPVLDGDQRSRDIFRQAGDFDRFFLIVTASGNRPAAAVDDHQRRLFGRFERPTERRRQRQPDDQRDDQPDKDGKSGKDIGPNQLPATPRARVGCGRIRHLGHARSRVALNLIAVSRWVT